MNLKFTAELCIMTMNNDAKFIKFTAELCIMAMNNDAKFKEELSCKFKINMKNLTNFDLSTQKSQKFTLKWAVFDQSI